MACTVKMIEASKCAKSGVEVFTLQLRYWRAIHAEFMTHRVFSRNAGSSRATPVRKVLSQVWYHPAGPIHWGANQAGMQASGEVQGWRREVAGVLWRFAGKVACGFAWGLMKLGLHKQVANRLLEPWQYINVLVTSTEWSNFFALRSHPDAQPEIQELSRAIEFAIAVERDRGIKELSHGEWHLPYVTEDERATLSLNTQLKLSTARCARISYEPFDGNASVEKECERHDLLVGSVPIHASPAEHQLKPKQSKTAFYANSRGFIQYRMFIEEGVDPA